MSRMISLILLIAWAGGSFCFAQEIPPILTVAGEKESEKLPLVRLAVEARILGPLAETRMTMTFANPHSRPLAAELYFPLPEGALVSGYALDIHGKMVDGVAVERERGRVIFEKEVRKGVDPGLAEWVRGNTFRTRVYPVPARGSRTVMVRYIAELAQSRGESLYHLSFRYAAPVDDFSLRVEVDAAGRPPRVQRSPRANFAFNRWRSGYLAEIRLAKANLKEDLTVSLPEGSFPAVLVERTGGGEHFFIASVPVPEKPKSAAPAVGKRLAVLWDASGSRGETGHQAEIDFLRLLFSRLSGTLTAVDLVLVRNDVSAPKRFPVQAGKAEDLLRELGAVNYDGGTQLGALGPLPERPDLYLLFSDGNSNFGKGEPAPFKAPLFAFSADSLADHAFLQYLASTNSGRYLNLRRSDAAAAVEAVLLPGFGLIGAEAAGASDLISATPFPASHRMWLVGKVTAASAIVTLKFGWAGRVTATRELKISQQDAAEGGLVETYWAQKKIERLLMRRDKNKEEILKTGIRYSLATPETSLLVLETLDQYLEHTVRPPVSWPEMRAQYDQALEAREKEEKKDREDKINRVLEMWKARVEWWGQKFDYPENFKYKEAEEKTAAMREEIASVGIEGGVAGGVEGAPMPAAPVEMSRMAGPEKKADASAASEPGVALAPWDPQTPYIKELKKADAAVLWKAYLEQRQKFGHSPAFFLDCADFFFNRKDSRTGLQVLSNLAELELENPALLRVLGHRLRQLGLFELSAPIFEEVLRLRPEEPQSLRDLALALAERKEYRRAVELLYRVVLGEWDRFDEIELIALMELNRTMAAAGRAGISDFAVDPRLVKLLDLDLRIVLTWDADLTDMDLWVVEPSGEKAYYGHNRTTIGGLVSRDFTQGYGPEEYLLKKAMLGTYKVQTNFYGSQAQTLIGAVTLQVDIYTNYGRPNEKKKSLTLRLTEKKETFTVGEVEF